jgi:copper chaperone CopZ
MNTVKVKGMSCGHCVASVTKALQGIAGVSDVQVDLEKGEARYQGDVDKQLIRDAIAKIGFEAA